MTESVTREQLHEYVKECVQENPRHFDLSDEHCLLIASFIRMKMTETSRKAATESINNIVQELQATLDNRKIPAPPMFPEPVLRDSNLL